MDLFLVVGNKATKTLETKWQTRQHNGNLHNNRTNMGFVHQHKHHEKGIVNNLCLVSHLTRSGCRLDLFYPTKVLSTDCSVVVGLS